MSTTFMFHPDSKARMAMLVNLLAKYELRSPDDGLPAITSDADHESRVLASPLQLRSASQGNGD